MKHLKSGESRSTTLARTLEREIFRGTFPPDSILPGTREIARQFGVSQRVVLCALDILEKKDLVLRQERKRVCVKAHAVHPGAKELLFFAFGEEVGLDSICQAVNELILRSGKDRKYDFFSRIVSTGDTWDHTRLDRELARLENLGFIDCVLFYCSLDEEGMRKCMRLPCPVIFLGEKPESNRLVQGARMISPNSADLPLTAAQYAVEAGWKKLIFVYWENTSRHRYERLAMQRLKDFVREKKLECRYVAVSGKDRSEVRHNFKEKIPLLRKYLHKGTLLAVHNIHSSEFEEGFLYAGISAAEGSFLTVHNIHSSEFEEGILLDPEQYPQSGLLTLDIPVNPAKCRIMTVERDLRSFQKELLEMVDHISEKIKGSLHRVADYHFRVQENKSQYILQKGE